MIASDIHGSAFWCEKLMDAFRSESPDKLLLLGDLLYHGPRNPFPENYDPQKVAQMLSEIKDKIICVRGNCDAEVDQLLLPFPMRADYALLFVDGKTLYATHGHLAGKENPPPLAPNEWLVNGHTHLPCAEILQGGVGYLNCGSVSLPKEDTPHSYLLVENGVAFFKDLESGGIFDEQTL